MKDFLEKFGLTEILAYIFPGAIGLCAVLLWGTVSAGTLVGTELAKNEILLAVLILTLAYAVGLILSMWDLQGVYFARQPRPFLVGRTWPAHLALRWSRLQWRYAKITAGSPQPKTAEILALDEIRSMLAGAYRDDRLELLEHHVLQVSVFRGAAADRLKEKGSVFAMEAETLRRRYMFAVGSAFALIVLSGSALTRLLAAVAGSIPMDALSDSAAWRTSSRLTFACLVVLVVTAGYSALRIWKGQRLLAGLLVVTCVIAAHPPAMVSTWPMAGPVTLAIICICVCAYLRDAVIAAKTMAVLFSLSAVCLLISAMRHVPLLWLYNDLADLRGNQSVGLQALLLISGTSYCASLTLRRVAARCWEHEVATTLAIVRLFGHQF